MPSPISTIKPAQALSYFINKAPKSQRAIGKLVMLDEGVLGNQHIRFFQSIGSVWLPKAMVARSWAEQLEQGFLEFVETALFFYSLPALANHILDKAALKLSPEKVSRNLIFKPLSEVAKQAPKALNKVAPLKAAIVLGGFSAIIAEYSLNFIKNLQTEKLFRKSKFSDVVNLSGGSLSNNEDSPVAKKARRRIKQCAVAATGVLAAAAGLAIFGSRSTLLQGVSKGILKAFDFNFKNGQAAISKPLWLTIIWIGGVVSYLDASRDKLETQEILTRVAAVVAPYYSFGKEAIQKGAVQLFGSRVPNILNPGKTDVKTLEALAGESVLHAQKALGVDASRKAILRKAYENFQPLLKAKNGIFWYPQLFGVVVVGFATALLSQYWTQRRFALAQAEKQHLHKHPEEPQAQLQRLYGFPGYRENAGRVANNAFAKTN